MKPSPRFCPFCANEDIEITTSPLPVQNIFCGLCNRRCTVDWWNDWSDKKQKRVVDIKPR